MADDQDPRIAPLAQQVRARRRALGLTQGELADLAGCSERFVYSIEQGKASVHLAKVLDVLRVLGLGLEVVTGRGDIRPIDVTGPPT